MLWHKILLAKLPEDISNEDWRNLRRVAYNLAQFEHGTKTKEKHLLNVLGFKNWTHLYEAFEIPEKRINIVLEIYKKHCLTGDSIETICNKTIDPQICPKEGQTLRNEYYGILKKLNVTIEDLFELEYGCTVQEYKESLAATAKVRINKNSI